MVSIIETETTACSFCGSDDAELLFVGHERWLGLGGEFPIVRCHRCGLIYLNPRPARAVIGRFYPPQYQPYARAIEDEESFLVRLDRRYGERKRCRAVERVARVGRILDVGCATGVFLNEMRGRGWETYGVEPGEVAATYAAQRFGLRVFSGELGEAEYPEGSFDVITMWDVLEHVFDPMTLLSDANRLLRGGGLLVLSFPNLDSIDVRLFGSCWAGWDVPRHLYAFPGKTFRLMLEKTGFSILRRQCFFGEQFVFSLSLRFWLQSRVNRAWISVLESLAGSYAIRALLKPYFALVQWLGKGSVVTTFAHKV